MGVLQGAQCPFIHLRGGVLGARTGRHGENFEGYCGLLGFPAEKEDSAQLLYASNAPQILI